MMTETRDPLLLSVFEKSRQDLDGAELTANVMGRKDYDSVLDKMRLGDGTLLPIPITLGVTAPAAWTLIGTSLLEFAVLISQFLTNPLIELGEGWLALVFLPVNNLASILVLSGKLALMGWKRLTGASLVR